MKPIVLFVLLVTQNLISQTVLQGKIISDIANLDGVLIANHTTKESTFTANGGYFSITAKVSDVLIVSSPILEGLEIKLNANSFKMIPLIIEVKSKANELEEISIKRITAKSLGIIDYEPKKYTVAERRLRTASTGGPVGLIANLITGQKKMLKKAVEYEKYETDAEKLLNLFTEDFYLHTLKIEQESIKGFLVFASENKQIAAMLQQKQIADLKLRLVELAFKFRELQK